MTEPVIVHYRSEVDQALVVHIDTEGIPDDGEHGPKIRIYLNDNPVYEDPVFPGLPVPEEESFQEEEAAQELRWLQNKEAE
jgi:hypothetical protein